MCASERQSSRRSDTSNGRRSVGKSRIKSPCTLNDPPTRFDPENTRVMNCVTPYWSEVARAIPGRPSRDRGRTSQRSGSDEPPGKTWILISAVGGSCRHSRTGDGVVDNNSTSWMFGRGTLVQDASPGIFRHEMRRCSKVLFSARKPSKVPRSTEWWETSKDVSVERRTNWLVSGMRSNRSALKDAGFSWSMPNSISSGGSDFPSFLRESISRMGEGQGKFGNARTGSIPLVYLFWQPFPNLTVHSRDLILGTWRCIAFIKSGEPRVQ